MRTVGICRMDAIFITSANDTSTLLTMILDFDGRFCAFAIEDRRRYVLYRGSPGKASGDRFNSSYVDGVSGK